MDGDKKKLPKDLDWNDVNFYKHQQEVEAMEDRDEWVPQRNRSHFNYTFIVVFLELVTILTLAYSKSFYGVSDVNGNFLVLNWVCLP